MSRTKVAICTPALGAQVHVAHAHAVAAALLYLEQTGDFSVGWINYANVASVTKARNAMVAQALHQGYDEIVMIDSDISFHPTALERLLRHDVDIVGAVQRNAPDGPAQWPVATIDSADTVRIKNGVAEVAAIPTCFFRTSARALEYLMYKEPDLQYHDPNIVGSEEYLYALFDYRIHGKKYEGEDWAFCRLARKHDLKVYADLEIPLVHHRTIPLTGSIMMAFQRQEEQA